MGNLATPEALVLRWDELCRDPSLQDLPYKMELNAWGKIEMSPASNRHGRLQATLAAELVRLLPAGLILTECASYGEITPYTRAPDICAEIVSPSNVLAEIEEKTAAYLAAGARDVWIVSQDGGIRYFSDRGESAQSAFGITVSLPAPIP